MSSPTADPDDWGDIENRLRAIVSRLEVAGAITAAMSGNADTIRARLIALAPDQLAAAIHRADMLAVIGEDIQQERAAAVERHPVNAKPVVKLPTPPARASIGEPNCNDPGCFCQS